MLGGQPVVFLSCSERFRDRVAARVRQALARHGIRGVIVADEPRLPHTGWEPEAKVESYLNASDAFVALCTPDDELRDGSIHCRQNVIDEIQRARNLPHLRGRMEIVKTPSVELPSNINPTYDRLDVDDVDEAVGAIFRQLEAWDVTAAA